MKYRILDAIFTAINLLALALIAVGFIGFAISAMFLIAIGGGQ